MEKFTQFIEKVDSIVWGLPLVILLALTGIYLTIRLKGLQLRKLGKGFKLLLKKDNKEKKEGELSSFQALCVALSATLGTGNIVGVATALSLGGPGALFWMVIMALFGMSTKYAEGFLAIRFRSKYKDGSIKGGPYEYIEEGLGPKFKWLAYTFAILGALAALMGIGTLTQVNSITSSLGNALSGITQPSYNIFGNNISLSVIIIGIVVTILISLVVLGGVKKISKVCEICVPVMAVIYVIISLLIIIFNITKVPGAIVTIVKMAFNATAAVGGTVGYAIKKCINVGVSRGIFSNEAGLGSEPIAASSANTDHPVKQGLISMVGTFIDTLVICTMTGIAIVISGSWSKDLGLEGINITIDAYQKCLPFPKEVCSIILATCVSIFAFTTIIGWSFYGEKCIGYVFNNNKKARFIYKILYILVILIGPYMTVSFVWSLSSIFNGLMAIPNLIGILALSSLIVRETNDYFKKPKDLLKDGKEEIRV